MRLGYDMRVEQQQKLIMTPELAQAINLLQMNVQELSSYVEEQLLSNPVLENESGPDSDYGKNSDHISDDVYDKYDKYEKEDDSYDEPEWRNEKSDWSEQINRMIEVGKADISYRNSGVKAGERDEYNFENFAHHHETLKEHLMAQLRISRLVGIDVRIAEYLIESLDEKGYLTIPIEEAASGFMTTPDRIEEVLGIIQSFEPSGVGARDLSECLRIQLSAKGLFDELYGLLITKYINAIADNKLSFVSKETGVPVIKLQQMSDVIRSLEPKPGRQFASKDATKYVIPDLILEKIDGTYKVVLSDNTYNNLRVNSYYSNMLSEYRNDRELTSYLKERVNSATWLIRAIEQRNETILKVANAIVAHQKDFFEKGEDALKPLNLKQIAEEVKVHESTVSRSVNGKYMQAGTSIYELKFFFKNSLSSGDGEGQIVTTKVKHKIRNLILAEDSQSPLSDQRISEILAEDGIEISRRTVAKYRDELGIASSSKRKRF